jgi:hypothetical protein
VVDEEPHDAAIEFAKQQLDLRLVCGEPGLYFALELLKRYRRHGSSRSFFL